MFELDLSNRQMFLEMSKLNQFLLKTLEPGDEIEFRIKGVRKIKRDKNRRICYFLMKDSPDVSKLCPPTFEKIGGYTPFALLCDREQNKYLYLKDIENILLIGLKIREKVGLFLKERIKRRNKLARSLRDRNA